MKNLKFIFLAIFLLTAAFANAQVSLSVRGGVNMSNIQTDEPNCVKSPKFGFNIGAFADFYVAHNMAIQSGLFFSTKGASENIREANELERTVTGFSYFQVPVHFAYKIDVAPGMRVVFHAGPYIALGVSSFVNVNDVKMRNAFGCRPYQYQPFDWGLGIGVGADFQRILVGIGLDFGLYDISNQSNVRGRNQNAFLTVGYRF